MKLLAKASALCAALLFSTAAMAADGPIDVGTTYSVLTPLLMSVATAAASVVAAVGAYAAVWLKRKLNLTDAEANLVGLNTDAAHRDALQTALTNAAGLALNRLGNELKGKTIDLRNPAINEAVATVLRSVPDAVEHFGLTNKPDELAQKVIAKLPQIANTTTSAAA